MFPNGRSVETPAAMPAADPDRRAGAGSAPAAIMPGAGHGTWAVPFDTDPSPARQAGQRPLNIRPGRHRGPPPPGRQIRQPVPHPRRPRQGRRRLRGAQGEHPGRGQEQHPDEGHDHALRAVRRGRARPVSPSAPARPCPGPGPRAGGSAARKGSLGVFTARRQGGPKSSASSSWVKPSPYSVFLHESGRYPDLVPPRGCARSRR